MFCLHILSDCILPFWYDPRLELPFSISPSKGPSRIPWGLIGAFPFNGSQHSLPAVFIYPCYGIVPISTAGKFYPLIRNRFDINLLLISRVFPIHLLMAAIAFLLYRRLSIPSFTNLATHAPKASYISPAAAAYIHLCQAVNTVPFQHLPRQLKLSVGMSIGILLGFVNLSAKLLTFSP